MTDVERVIAQYVERVNQNLARPVLIRRRSSLAMQKINQLVAMTMQ